MSAVILDGKSISAEIRSEAAARTAALRKNTGIVPCLAVILVGDDPASAVYVRSKERACEETGIRSFTVRYPANVDQETVITKIRELNSDPTVHSILVQLPLPSGMPEAALLAAISPEKDADGFHLLNTGRLFAGQETILPCTPRGIMEMLRRGNVPLEGRHAVVIGRSNIVGKPVAMLLLNANCTVTICHSRTQGLPSITRQADILVAAVGRAGFVTADMVKPGAAVIDVGINRVDGKVTGDVDFAAVSELAGWITPVPGGVGKMTIAMLILNTIEAAERFGKVAHAV